MTHASNSFSSDNFAIDTLQYYAFPKSPHTLVARGGALSAGVLLSAYEQGVFPWGRDDEKMILWCAPKPRCVLYPKDLRVNNTTKKVLKKHPYTLLLDKDFTQIMTLCATVKRNNQEGSTWIDDSFIQAYSTLHSMGFAHSVGVYDDKNQLIGGLYGLFLGSVFFGESMFSLAPNASKIAFFSLVKYLETHHSLSLVDCQVESPHMQQWGASSISAVQFTTHLQHHATRKNSQYHWQGVSL